LWMLGIPNLHLADPVAVPCRADTLLAGQLGASSPYL
jgi:hypothetical protein